MPRRLWCKVLAEIARFLEKLLEMRFAVQDSIHRGVAAHRKKSFAMAAFEAGFMIRYPFERHHINHIDSLITSLAFIQSSCECHSLLLLLLLFYFLFLCLFCFVLGNIYVKLGKVLKMKMYSFAEVQVV